MKKITEFNQNPSDTDTLQQGRGVKNSTVTLLISIALVGPLAIPLVWMNTRFTKRTKIIWTTLIILWTVLLCWIMGASTKVLMLDKLKEIEQM